MSDARLRCVRCDGSGLYCVDCGSSPARCVCPSGHRGERVVCDHDRGALRPASTEDLVWTLVLHYYSRSESCAADCSDRTYQGPVCPVCLCCRGCAGAYSYAPNGRASGRPCPGCRI